MASVGGPRCPNHHVPLTRTNERRIGICPVSGYRFAFEANDKEKERKYKVDLTGNLIPTNDEFKITPLDGDGG